MMNRVIRGVAALSLATLVATGCGTMTGAAAGAIYDVTRHNS